MIRLVRASLREGSMPLFKVTLRTTRVDQGTTSRIAATLTVDADSPRMALSRAYFEADGPVTESQIDSVTIRELVKGGRRRRE